MRHVSRRRRTPLHVLMDVLLPFLMVVSSTPMALAQATVNPKEAPLLSSPDSGAELAELAGLLGGMAALETRCKVERLANPLIQALIETEPKDSGMRTILTDRFNRTYRQHGAIYQQCTEHARHLLTRYQDNAIAIANRLIEAEQEAENATAPRQP
jgi:uncharacterized protein (TIGR02301 family)